MSRCFGFKSCIFSIQLLLIAIGCRYVAANSVLLQSLTPYNLVNVTTATFNYTDGSPICMEEVCPQNKTYFEHFAW
jgi:hypothetical protein